MTGRFKFRCPECHYLRKVKVDGEVHALRAARRKCKACANRDMRQTDRRKTVARLKRSGLGRQQIADRLRVSIFAVDRDLNILRREGALGTR